MVTGTDCRLAKTNLSRYRVLSGVTRDDLSQPHHSGTRCSKKRATTVPAVKTQYSPFPACKPEGDGLGGLPGAVSISERPATVEDRAVPGHWEGDLIEGCNYSCIATLVERHSRYVMLVKLENKKTETVVAVFIKQAKKLPDELYKSLTWDRGTEMKGYQKFTLATNIQVYFCYPQSPWQRGSNENTNRLLRQYLPNRTDLSVHTQAELNRIARRLNERPRKSLGYETPADRFNTCVASIH